MYTGRIFHHEWHIYHDSQDPAGKRRTRWGCLGLFSPAAGHGPSRSSAFLESTWILFSPSWLPSQALASQLTPHFRVWSLSNQLDPSFVPLVTGMKSRHSLLGTTFLNNPTPPMCFPLASARPLVCFPLCPSRGEGKCWESSFPGHPAGCSSGLGLGTMLGREDGEKIARDDGVRIHPSSSSA